VKVLATYSIKGGVGKTSTAVNLAALAAGEGRRTLVWDLDPQGAASFLFRVRPKVKGGGGKLVRGRRDPLSVLKGTDVEGLDCPPSISLVSENVFTAADVLLVPLVPSTLSVRTFEQLQDFLARGPQPAPDVVAFLSMVDRRRRLHRDLAASLPDALPGVAHASIPVASAVEQMGVHRVPLVVNHPRSPAGRAYADLWAEVAPAL
jgi:chromosome partitioning protein